MISEAGHAGRLGSGRARGRRGGRGGRAGRGDPGADRRRSPRWSARGCRPIASRSSAFRRASRARASALFGSLRDETATMIFYEAPDRVGATLADLATRSAPIARASLGRELTKIHEEHVRGTLGELAARYADGAAARRVHARRRGRRPRRRRWSTSRPSCARCSPRASARGCRGAPRRRDRQAAPRSSTSSRCRCSEKREP